MCTSHACSKLNATDLNGDTIEVLGEPPTAIEFSRLVHISRPVVIKGAFLSQIQAALNENAPRICFSCPAEMEQVVSPPKDGWT